MSLLRQPNFRRFWIGETISGAGTSMAAVGVPLLAVTVLRASTFAVAALTSAAYLPWLVIGLPAGAWVDRLPARPLMIACDTVAALLYASLPAAAWLGLLRIWPLVVTVLLAGAANVVFATAYQVCLPEIIAQADLTEGNAKLQAGASVASIGGRGAAGLAAQAVGAAPALPLNAASFPVLGRLPPAHPPPGRQPRTTTSRHPGRPAVRGPRSLPAPVHPVPGGRQPGLHRQPGPDRRVPGPRGRPAARRRRPAHRDGRPGRPARRGLRPAAGSPARHRPRADPGHPRFRPVRPAHPADRGRVTAAMRVLAYGAVPLGALLAGALGTALGVRDGLWLVQVLFAASGLLLLTRDIRTVSNLPSRR